MTKNYDIFFTVNNFILVRSFWFLHSFKWLHRDSFRMHEKGFTVTKNAIKYGFKGISLMFKLITDDVTCPILFPTAAVKNKWCITNTAMSYIIKFPQSTLFLYAKTIRSTANLIHRLYWFGFKNLKTNKSIYIFLLVMNPTWVNHTDLNSVKWVIKFAVMYR